MEHKLLFYEMKPCPVGIILETEPRRMIRVGETLDSMRSSIGEPIFKATANEWGTFSGAIEIYGYPGGGVFKVPIALIFANGKLATFAEYKDAWETALIDGVSAGTIAGRSGSRRGLASHPNGSISDSTREDIHEFLTRLTQVGPL